MLAPRHRQRVIGDPCGREPWLGIGIARSGAESLKLTVEAYSRRVFVARHSSDLGKLVGKLSVDTAAISLVILKAESRVVDGVGIEGVVPVHSQD